MMIFAEYKIISAVFEREVFRISLDKICGNPHFFCSFRGLSDHLFGEIHGCDRMAHIGEGQSENSGAGSDLRRPNPFSFRYIYR